ncbi:unnamed protein product [Mytilus coruscus]|uniref:NADAR domain-containing protein n=1 Tax=Mytilus coruscus TaxID=42192 RepID=A0A6J8CZZ5_MYTCO|nr:unnamed protein product [Mytilus coruscus]
MKSESFLSLVNRKASYLNNKLHTIAKSIPRLTYVGHHSFVVDGKLQRHLLSKDGLHLTRDGATTVVRDLEAEIRRQRRPCTPVHFMRLPTMRPYSLNYTQQATITQQDQPPIPTPFRDALKAPTQYTQPSTHTKPLAVNNMVDFPSLPSRGLVPYLHLVSVSLHLGFVWHHHLCVSVVSPVRPPVASPSRAFFVSLSRVRVVSPSSARVVSPSLARVASPARAVSPSRARVVSPSRARVASPSCVRVVSPVRPPVASPSRAHAVSPSRARAVSPSRARAASPVYDPDFKPPTAGNPTFTAPPIYYKGPSTPLSNFFPCTLVFNGITFPSSEHVYQYVKAVEHSQFSLANQIRHAKTAQDAKHLSKFIKTSSHWFGIQWFFMYNLSWLKFQQCEKFTTCFHILAAKMSIGQEPIEKRTVVNLRLLTKNNRKELTKISMYDTLTTSSEIQISQIYSHDKKRLLVKIPEVQKQTNSIDCGLFAIANAVEFCFTSFSGGIHVEFDTEMFREHLVICLEKGEFIPFPKKKIGMKGKPKYKTSVVECNCECGKCDSVEDMLGCEWQKGVKNATFGNTFWYAGIKKKVTHSCALNTVLISE